MDVVVFKFNVEAIEFNLELLPEVLDFFVAELLANGQSWTRDKLCKVLKQGGSITVTAMEEEGNESEPALQFSD